MKAALNFSKIAKAFALGIAFAAFTVIGAHAQAHPAYLHALQDLRDARAHLDKLTPSEHLDDEQVHAIRVIDAAIGDIKQAAIDDGKSLDDHLPVDAHLTRTGRFHKALELLGRAHQDIAHDEDNGYAHGLRNRALGHIDEAHRTVEHIISTLPN